MLYQLELLPQLQKPKMNELGPCEKFIANFKPYNKITLKTAFGKYVSSRHIKNEVICSNTEPTLDDEFNLIQVSGNVYSLSNRNQFLCCNGSGNYRAITCDRKKASKWESFTLELN